MRERERERERQIGVESLEGYEETQEVSDRAISLPEQSLGT